MSRKSLTGIDTELLKRIADCQGSPETNGWEEDFLSSITLRVARGLELSVSQLDTFERIEYKVQFGEDAYWEEYGGELR